MKHLASTSRSIHSALSLLAAFALACGAADEDGASNVPPAFGGVTPGAPAPGAAGTSGGSDVTNPPAGDPNQPANTPSETPVQNGETPLTGSEGNGNGTGQPPVDPGNPQSPGDPGQPQDPGQPGPQNPPARGPGGTANLFSEVLGRSQAEVDAKVQTAVDRFFGIGGNDPATPTLNGGARSFYTLPQDPSMGFVWAADSNDIRSEGMSYGMFIAVQMDMQQQFDQLWRFAQRFMQYSDTPTYPAWARYFRWTGTVNTANANNWTVTYNAEESPASDGEEYFAAALYLADRRWGSGGAINYEQEADAIASAMLNNPPGSSRFPLFHADENMVVFVPIGTSNEHSDPSYHLPAFYEIFAQDGPAADAARWLEIAEVSRDYLVRSANANTGLHPDYANFDGTPTQGFQASDHDTFSFDAWRVPMNMAVDYAWSNQDQRMRTQVEKYHAFFANNLGNGNVSNSRFAINGTGGMGGGSQALVASLAAGALATNGGNRMTFVNNLWNIAQPTGNFRYYQGSVYLLGLLATAGYFAYGWE
ncbi:MAG TPA: glycosyl hydrolase family 8 [Polyangiaceae bacterium]|nr:glycosyl hydrolase family 8 [Polyangiaceae bacterium]